MCRAEAPDVERFARENADKVTVIGLGTQDSFGEAEDFVDTYGTVSFPMLWDESFETWAQLGVSGQPAGMLFSADGTAVGRWSGGIPEDDVLARIAEM